MSSHDGEWGRRHKSRDDSEDEHEREHEQHLWPTGAAGLAGAVEANEVSRATNVQEYLTSIRVHRNVH